MKVAICTMIKNENLYLRDWVLYHQSIGVDNIILYDNNDINGDKVFSVIGDLIDSGYVLYHDIRGVTKDNIEIDIETLRKSYDNSEKDLRNMLSMTLIQIKYFQEGFDLYKKDFDWIGFFDTDEYFTLVKNNDIKDYLSIMNNVDELFFNWKCYGDNNKLHYESKPLNERFPDYVEPLNFTTNTEDHLNMITKCMIHCKPDNYNAKFLATIHFIIIYKENPFYANNIGNRLYIRDNQAYYRVLYNYDAAYIKHFYTKTIYEYLYMRRSFNENSNDNEIVLHISRFFDFNICNNEKISVLEHYLNKINKGYLLNVFKERFLK